MNNMTAEENIVAEFENEITRQEDIVYGVALFFECLSVLHADNSAIIETCSRQLRNVIQKGNERIQHARQLLDDAVHDPQKRVLIRQFTFSPCEGYPNPDEMTKRAGVLVDTYKRVFPGRSRAKDFSEEEIFSLIEEASLAFE